MKQKTMDGLEKTSEKAAALQVCIDYTATLGFISANIEVEPWQTVSTYTAGSLPTSVQASEVDEGLNAASVSASIMYLECGGSVTPPALRLLALLPILVGNYFPSTLYCLLPVKPLPYPLCLSQKLSF